MARGRAKLTPQRHRGTGKHTESSAPPSAPIIGWMNNDGSFGRGVGGGGGGRAVHIHITVYVAIGAEAASSHQVALWHDGVM